MHTFMHIISQYSPYFTPERVNILLISPLNHIYLSAALHFVDYTGEQKPNEFKFPKNTV